MADKEKKNKIVDILLDFYDEYDSNVINRPMIPNIYAGKVLDSLKEKPVSIDFEQELYKAFGQVKDFTLGMRIAKWFYDMGKNSQDHVSEELEEAALEYANNQLIKSGVTDTNCPRELAIAQASLMVNGFKAGTEWQITKLMKNATEVTVHIDAGGYPYAPEIELYDYDKDVPLAKEGDKYKVVLIKEE